MEARTVHVLTVFNSPFCVTVINIFKVKRKNIYVLRREVINKWQYNVLVKLEKTHQAIFVFSTSICLFLQLSIL